MRSIRITASCLAAALCLSPCAGITAEAADEPSRPKMMLVLDSSGSMAKPITAGTRRIDAAKQALRAIISDLPPDLEVGLRVYGATVFKRSEPGACTDSQLVVPPGGTQDELTAALADYKPYGETPIGHALSEAGRDLGSSGQRTIVLVSDGEPTCRPDPCVVAGRLAKDGIDVRIDVIGLDVTGRARDALRCIAERGRGTYYDVGSVQELIRSVDVSTTRANRPFDLTGTPVDGSEDPGRAPAVSTGLWLDEFPGDSSPLWYRIDRTAPGSTVHVGLTHRSTDIGNAGQQVTIATHADPESSECNSASTFARGSLAFTGTSSADRDPESDCNTADSILVDVHALARGEDLAGQSFELAVYEEPPVSDPPREIEDESRQRPAWTPMSPSDATSDVVPGTSVSNAPVVADGTLSLDINPGETQAVAVPLDWGEHLQAQIDARVTRRSIGDYARPAIQITGPLRQEVGGDYTDSALSEDWTDFGRLPADKPSDYRWGRQALPVSYEHRFAVEDWWAGSAIPGLRYVLVSLPQDAAGPISYQLSLKTLSGEGAELPDYERTDGLVAPQARSALVTDSSPAQAQPQETTSEPRSSTPGSPSAERGNEGGGTPWGALGAGLGLLGVVLGAILVVGRRRGRQSG